MLSKLKVIASGVIGAIQAGLWKALSTFNACCVVAFLLLGTITLCSGIVLILKALLALAMSAGLVVNVAAAAVLAAGLYGGIVVYIALKDTELDDIFNLAKVYLFGGVSLVFNLIRMFIAWLGRRGDN